jgi:hypothetical protein
VDAYVSLHETALVCVTAYTAAQSLIWDLYAGSA